MKRVLIVLVVAALYGATYAKYETPEGRKRRINRHFLRRWFPALLAASALLLTASCGGGGGGAVEGGGDPAAVVPANAAVGVAFTDLDPDGGQIQGAPTFTPAADESDVVEYRLYWGQAAKTKLAGNDAVIATVPVGGGTSFAAFAANRALPAGATHLVVFTANAAAR